jgi:hypothetical protein
MLNSVIEETSACERIIKTAAFLLPFFFLATPSNAACYTEGASGRLSNKCAIDKLDGVTVDAKTAELIDLKLKSEGNRQGLGFPLRIKPNTLTKAIYPVLAYSENINGGSSPAPLMIGNLGPFTVEEEFFSQEGALAGLGLGVSGRYIYDEGRYLTYGANASYAHSPQHGIGITTTSANVCSVNHVKNWWYVDACANSSRVRKDLTDNTNSNLSIKSSKVFESSDGIYSEASFGINRYFAESYTQNQLIFGYDTIHSNGVFSAFNVTLGESVKDKLTTKFAVSGSVSTQLAGKSLKLTASYSKANGEKWFSVERSENTYSVSATYPIWRNFRATLGYRRTDSTIDYFDVRTPTFGIQFVPIEF